MAFLLNRKLPEPEIGKFAHQLQIVKADEDDRFVLDEDKLGAVLLQNNIKDRFVVVISVAGAFRKGKSFLLDFFLRYMYAKYVQKDASHWLGSHDAPLRGFTWRGGSERDTTGILIWSEVFLHDMPSGEKVAIVLMDTQGAFDSQSSVRECATVFALSTMLSSVQVFNISQNVQEDDLQHLQLFTEYGRLALADSGKKPFQRLQFLVRDWSYPYEAPYGAVGGKQILKKRLEVTAQQHADLRSLRRHIISCFTEIACFLMPHPGLKVTSNPHYDGRLSDIEPDFIKSLKELVPMLLAPENLILKEINGQKVRAQDLAQYFKSYIAIYKGNDLPEPKTVLYATAEANNLTAVAAAKGLYTTLMEDFCGGSKPYLNPDYIEAEHLVVKEKAMEKFSSKRKMGGEEFSARYRDQLLIDLEVQLVSYKAYNDSKNIFTAGRTPAVYFVLAIVMYILNVIFSVIGLGTFANFCSFIMGISLISLALWAYIRYSGEMLYIGEYLDQFTAIIWLHRHLLIQATVVGMVAFIGITHLLAMYGKKDST